MPKQTTTEKAAATPAKKTASRKKVVFTLQFAGKELTVAEMEAQIGRASCRERV